MESGLLFAPATLEQSSVTLISTLGAARIKFPIIALQETNTKEEDVRRMKDGTLVYCGEKLLGWNVGGVEFVVHPLVVHLVDSHEVLSARLSSDLCQKIISIIICYSPTSAAKEHELDLLYKDLEEAIYNKKFCISLLSGTSMQA